MCVALTGGSKSPRGIYTCAEPSGLQNPVLRFLQGAGAEKTPVNGPHPGFCTACEAAALCGANNIQ
jgi:hypothetical protein